MKNRFGKAHPPRIPHVCMVSNFDLRICHDAAWLTDLGPTATDVLDTIKEQNWNIETGKLARTSVLQDQAFEYRLNMLAHLKEVEQFESFIVRCRMAA